MCLGWLPNQFYSPVRRAQWWRLLALMHECAVIVNLFWRAKSSTELGWEGLLPSDSDDDPVAAANVHRWSGFDAS